MVQLMDLKVVATMSYLWKELGLYLEFNYEMLNYININNETSRDRCLALLHNWVSGKASAPTWEKLIEALKKLERTDLADKLNKFLSSK